MKPGLKNNTAFTALSTAAIVILLLIVVLSSIAPLSGYEPGQGGFGDISTWISFAAIIVFWGIPFISARNGSPGAKKFLTIVMIISTILMVLMIIFAFTQLTVYNPKGLLFGLILLAILYVIIAIAWFGSANQVEPDLPLQNDFTASKPPYQTHQISTIIEDHPVTEGSFREIKDDRPNFGA